MEKYRNKSGSEFSRRLLTFFVFCFLLTPLHGRFLTNKDFENLRFTPYQNENDTQDFYTSTDIRFEVIVPSVEPGEIEVASPDDIDNVSFRTLKRTQWDLEGEIGTKIEVWYSFSKRGIYNLPPLTVRVQGFKRSIQFEPVTIKLNPKDQSPIVILKFSNGQSFTSEEGFEKLSEMEFTAGKAVNFEVLFQYGVQLVNFHWDLPKDSIFTQTKAYDIIETKYKEKTNADEIIPVSAFEWIPLVPGEAAFPAISITLTSNNGYKGEIKIPAFSVAVAKNVHEEKVVENNLFDQAFEQVEQELVVVKEAELSQEDCEKIAAEKMKKRYLIIAFFYGSIVLVLTSLILFIIMLRKKNLFTNILTSLFMIFAITCFSLSIVESNKTYGVSKGCQLYSIPDELSEARSELSAGSYVEIKESSGDWFYVLLGESGGWCNKENVIQIK